jgi:hypothetical protein
VRTLLLIGLILTLAPAVLADDTDRWHHGADLRAGLYASERDTRDGEVQRDSSAEARFRAWLQNNFADEWRFRTRLAGRASTAGNDFGLRFDRYRATPTGTNAGEVHVDEFYLGHGAPGSDHQWRVGRFQTAINLPVVPGKSLDRNDSSNVGIGWTDGVHWQARISDTWTSHLIGQLNHRRGAGNTVRSPLDFSASGSRLGGYFALEATEHPGPLVMRVFSINWIPDALAADGRGGDRREDYVTAAVKSAAAWPLGDQGTRFLVAGELGQAFNRPRPQALSLPGEDEVSGTAWQFSANLFDLRPGHHLGAVYGRAGAGWLTSNDYRNNDELFEIRYQRRFTSDLSVEVRYRWRRELERRTGASELQVDEDVYARVTWRIR